MENLITKNVPFEGTKLLAVQNKATGKIYASINSILRELGFDDRQIEYRRNKWISDKVLGKGVQKFLYPSSKDGGIQETYCIEIKRLPLALAKIEVTPKMEKLLPDLSKKLEKYQEQCADVLADAFLENTQTSPLTLQQKIQTIAKGTDELYQRVDAVDSKVDEVKAEIEALRDELPLFPSEADKISNAAKRKGVEVLGGKQSNAYKNGSLQHKVYTNIYANLKYNFGVSSYKSIKRGKRKEALRIVEEYKPPYFLAEQIEMENAQQSLNV